MARGFHKKNSMHVVGSKKPQKSAKSRNKESVLQSPVELSPAEEAAFKTYQKYYEDKKIWKSTMTSPLRILVRLEFLSAHSIAQLKADNLIQTFSNGTKNISPELSAFIKLHSQYMELQHQYGMTPKAAQQVRGLVDESQLSLFETSKSPFAEAR